MAKVKIKAKDIIPTLEEMGIETEEFDNLERLVGSLIRLKNLGKVYIEKKNARRRIYAVGHLENHIHDAINKLSECYGVLPKHLYEHISVAVDSLCHALTMVKSMRSLETDPVAEIAAMIHSCDTDKLVRRIQKHMKKLAIRQMAESTVKREVDSSATDPDEENREDDSKESCTVTLAVGIRGIMDDTQQSNIFIDNGIVSAKVERDPKGDFWFILDNYLGDKTVKYKFRITGSAQQKKDKLAEANKTASFINHIQYLSASALGVKYKQLEEEGLEDLVEYIRIEPVNDKDEFVDSGLRLSVYVDLLVDFAERKLVDCSAAIYNEREFLINSRDSIFNHQLSEIIGFGEGFDEQKPFSKFKPFSVSETPW